MPLSAGGTREGGETALGGIQVYTFLPCQQNTSAIALGGGGTCQARYPQEKRVGVSPAVSLDASPLICAVLGSGNKYLEPTQQKVPENFPLFHYFSRTMKNSPSLRFAAA